MTSVPDQFSGSPALQLVQSRGWTFEVNGSNIRLLECPYCGKHTHPAFVMEIHGSTDDPDQRKRDGLHICHRCGRQGSLRGLQEHLGIAIPGVIGTPTYDKKVDSMIDVEAAHQALLEDADAMDYLMNGRGFSRDIIVKQKIGFVPKKFFRSAGENRAIVYPYLVNGNCVFWHYRTLPTMPLSKNKVPKDFITPTGWDATLYNSGVLLDGLKDLIIVEGEANCIAAMDKGVENICGVPGANFKKADWIEKLDKIESLERIYLCYDKDKPGQKAAQQMAARIGFERCWKIKLPDFTVTTDEGETRQGKDLNEYFAFGGGTAESFEKLKAEAVQCDVDGVTSSIDALSDLEEKIIQGGLEPKYKSGWASLNKLVGFDEGDVIDIIAPEKIGKTTFGMDLMEHMVHTYNEDGVIICLEMMTDRMARKWVAHVSGFADNIPKTPEEGEKLKQEFLTKALPFARYKALNREGRLYFCYPQYKTDEDIYTLMRDCTRRYGVKWIMLDNLQRLCDSTLGGKNRTVHLSQISKKSSQIAKDFGVQLIRILQPHRIKDGQIVTTDDVDGSSQCMKDCDCAITLHRNRVGEISANDFASMGYIETESSFDEKMLVSLGLSRYSSGGYTTLYYDGPRSTVTEYDVAKIAAIKTEASKTIGHTAQLEALGITQPTATPAQTPVEPLGEITL